MLVKFLVNLNYKYLLCLFAVIWILSPTRHAKRYSYVRKEDVLRELCVNSNSNETNLNLTFQNLINSNKVHYLGDIYELRHFKIPDKGGEYTSTICKSEEKTAIIVPYRDRAQQLQIFLNYMHYFLQRQSISYRIFIVQQMDTKPFNRAKLLNYGAFEAMKLKFSCLILHDVDLLPISTGNIYACSKRPRHMSSSLDVFRYLLPYPNLFGGVVSITSEQFEMVNGMSNEYDGWGAEDDDFHKRLLKFNITPYRFSPELSMYVMLKHNKAQPNEDRFHILKDSLKRQDRDGLNSLTSNYDIKLEDLYTNVRVY